MGKAWAARKAAYFEEKFEGVMTGAAFYQKLKDWLKIKGVTAAAIQSIGLVLNSCTMPYVMVQTLLRAAHLPQK